jgi:hypothetical protein
LRPTVNSMREKVVHTFVVLNHSSGNPDVEAKVLERIFPPQQRHFRQITILLVLYFRFTLLQYPLPL